MTPMEMAAAAVRLASTYDNDVLIFIRDGKLLVDADQVWPDCGPDTLCEGGGEYRRVAEISMFDGSISWADPAADPCERVGSSLQEKPKQ